MRQIAETLACDGVPTRRGRPWSIGAVHRSVNSRGAIRGRVIGHDVPPFKGLVGQPIRELLKRTIARPEQLHAVCLRRAVGEITSRELVLAALFQLWARALDRTAPERTFTRQAVVERCAQPARECRDALGREHLLDEIDDAYQLTIAGFAAAAQIIDVAAALAVA